MRRHVARGLVAALLLVGAWVSWFGASDDGGEARLLRPRAPSTSGSRPTAVGEGSTVVVPSVIALHGAFAGDLLRDTHLRPGSITLELSREPWGSVIDQSIDPGTQVALRTAIDLVVARGALPARCWPDCETSTDPATARPRRSAAADAASRHRMR